MIGTCISAMPLIFDQETGAHLHPTGASILIKWSEVEFLEFQEIVDSEQD